VLEAERERTSGYDDKDAREQVQARMRPIAAELKRDPQLESILQRRAQELGIERGSRLDRVLKAPTIERALDLSVRDLGRHRDRGAFEDLRAEVSVLRRSVELLPEEWEANRGPDYTSSPPAGT